MAFYIATPQGECTISELEESTRQRLICYKILSSCEGLEEIAKLNYLTENSVLDVASHYALRLSALKGGLCEKQFISNEVELLAFKLDRYEAHDVKKLIEKLHLCAKNEIKKLIVDGRLKRTYQIIHKICWEFLDELFFDHAFQLHDGMPCLECEDYKFEVPFEYVSELLPTMQYEIINRQMHIFSYQWKNLILSLYRNYLKIVLKEMAVCEKVFETLKDPRIDEVVSMARKVMSGNKTRFTKEEFNLKKFNGNETEKFPPCMRHLADILKENNRLGHEARYNFGLFLKDIGISFESAIEFWKHFYSKPHGLNAQCKHTWIEKESRYTYQIKYMYGMLAVGKDKTMKLCADIEDLGMSLKSECCCPFRHFNDDSLRRMLHNYLNPTNKNVEVIIRERKRKPKLGCELYFQEMIKRQLLSINNEEIVYHDPAQFYLLIKGLEENQKERESVLNSSDSSENEEQCS